MGNNWSYAIAGNWPVERGMPSWGSNWHGQAGFSNTPAHEAESHKCTRCRHCAQMKSCAPVQVPGGDEDVGALGHLVAAQLVVVQRAPEGAGGRVEKAW